MTAGGENCRDRKRRRKRAERRRLRLLQEEQDISLQPAAAAAAAQNQQSKANSKLKDLHKRRVLQIGAVLEVLFLWQGSPKGFWKRSPKGEVWEQNKIITVIGRSQAKVKHEAFCPSHKIVLKQLISSSQDGTAFGHLSRRDSHSFQLCVKG